MLNERYQDRPGDARRYLCPSTVLSGDAVLLGTQALVALTSYDTATGTAVFRFAGTFDLSVIGETQHSPQVAAAIAPGGRLYAAGTLDSPTNMTTGLIINADNSKTPFGNLDDTAVTSGMTQTKGVKLKESGQ